MRDDPEQDTDDARILANMASHLHCLAEDAAQVGATVSDLTAAVGPLVGPKTIHDLQKIDTLRQSLSDLAHLSAAMAATGEHRARALQALKLSATRRLVTPISADPPDHQGSIDFF